MPQVESKYEHIALDEKGVPVITGTTMKVIEMAAEKIAYGWSPEELHLQHPHLAMEQIHSALAYYYDHEDKLNKDIEHRLQGIQQYRPLEKTPLREKLKNRSPV